MRNLLRLYIGTGLLTFILPLFTLFLLGCSHDVIGPGDRAAIKSFSYTVATERQKGVAYAEELKKQYKPDSDVYKTGKQYYIAAFSAFNGWIDAYKVSLEIGGASLPATDKQWIDKAAAANKKFIEYVTDPNKPQPKVLPGAAVAADIIIDVAFKFWDRYQKAKKEERERLIRIIDQLKWPEFDSIKA